MRLERILCPVDFSDTSQHAIDHALALARWYGAHVTALHAYDPTGSDDDVERLRAEMVTELRRRGSIDARVDIRVEAGGATRSILDCAASLPADLIVMGTHGLSGFEHLVLGSVAEKVLRRARCPVFTVPPRVHSTSVLPFKQLLCAVDFSPSSAGALDFAFSVAAESEARLTLLHVLEWPWPEPPAPAFDELPHDEAVQLAEFRRAREADALERLGALVPGLVRDDRTPISRCAHGKPYVEILRVAGEQRTDLIVLGVHGGRHPVGLSVLGSTANQVVRQATCPVVTMRSSH
ncbi:MAG: universal stress protein [Acidobacteriota bacterium]